MPFLRHKNFLKGPDGKFIAHAADVVGDHQQPEVQVKRFSAGSGVLVILLVIAGEDTP